MKTDPKALLPWVEAGFPLIPLHFWRARRNGKPLAKVPADKRWREKRYPGEEMLERLRTEAGNVGVVAGEADLWLDIDVKHSDAEGRDADQLVAALERELGVALSGAPSFETPSGGRRLLFSKPAGMAIRRKLAAFGGAIEFLTAGRQTATPGSRHDNGGLYVWSKETAERLALGYSLRELIPPAPEALLAALRCEPRASRASAQIPLEQALACLTQLDASEYRAHDDWFELLCAFHAATGGSAEGREAFVQWSIADTKYADHAESIRARWNSLEAGKAGGLTVATLYHHVLDAGGHVPHASPEEDFSDPPAEPDEVPRFERTAAGKPKSTYANARLALRALSLRLARNDLTHAIELQVPELPFTPPDLGRVWTVDLARLTRELFIERFGLEVSLDHVHEAAQTASLERRFDPLLDYLESLHWDGTPRISSWLWRYAGAAGTPFSGAVGRLMLLGTVARAYEPGIDFQSIVVLEGAQGVGKSRMLRTLAGPWFREVPTGLALADRDTVAHLLGGWIAEWPDLAGLGSHEVEMVKAWISRRSDRARFAYEREMKDYPRRFTVWGTTNASLYLQDSTGARRFWPVRVEKVELEALAWDRDQLWAEAVVEWKRKPSTAALELPPRLYASAAEEQETRRVSDPWEDRVADFLAKKSDVDRIPSSKILEGICSFDAAMRASPRDYKRLATVMQRLGWQRIKFRIDGAPHPIAGWERGS